MSVGRSCLGREPYKRVYLKQHTIEVFQLVTLILNSNPLTLYVHNCVQSKFAAFSEYMQYVGAICSFQVNFASFMLQIGQFFKPGLSAARNSEWGSTLSVIFV